MSILPPQPVVVFKINPNVPQFIQDAAAVAAAILANVATFATPVPDVATVQANIAALQAAETNVLNETGSTEDRDLVLLPVIANMKTWRMYVQTIVDITPSEAAAIVARADMKLKVVGQRPQTVFHAKNDELTGSINLFAAGGPMRSFHEWAISNNNINWTALTPTLNAVTPVTSLAVGSRQYFRHRITTGKDGQGAWEQSFAIIIT